MPAALPRGEDAGCAGRTRAAGEQKILHRRGERSESPVAPPTAAARLTKRNIAQARCGVARATAPM